MSFASHICRRFIATTPANLKIEPLERHKAHLGRIVLFNKRHQRQHKKELFRPFEKPPLHKGIPRHDYGCRGTGVRHEGRWEKIPEMVPELVVPKDLEDFPLKPYVSYRTREINQEELTSKDLFNVIYGKKILRDFREGRLDADGNSLQPSKEEETTAEEARAAARRTGSDLFEGGAPRSKLWKVRLRYMDTDKDI